MMRSTSQRGAVLLVGLLMLMAAMAAGLMVIFGQKFAESRRSAVTSKALAAAKEGLISYSLAIDLTAGATRPGSLPCPDRHAVNDPDAGKESTPCSTNATSLGRLPWRTLGLPDLRDGSGERLWYSVSDRFRRPNQLLAFGGINPDTYGRISLRNIDGTTFLAAANTANGAAALIIAPGPPLRRMDGMQQARSNANYLLPQHYLDCAGNACATEDNANFVQGSAGNGFIAGTVFTGQQLAVNDQILTLSANELITASARAVARTVLLELDKYFVANGKLPMPADVGDTSCLGRLTISTTGCLPGSNFIGRVPANPVGGWAMSTTFLDRDASNNWFQSNSWREHVFYAVSPACTTNTPKCITGSLQVNNSPYSPVGNVKYLVVVGNVAIAPNTHTAKDVPSNYLEDENATWGNMIFAKRLAYGSVTPFNDVLEFRQ